MLPIRPLGFGEIMDLPFALVQANLRVVGAALGVALGGSLAVVFVAVGLLATVSDTTTATVWTVVVAALVTAWVSRLWLRGIVTAVGAARVGMSFPDAVATVRRRLPALAAAHGLQSLLGVGIIATGLLCVTLPFVPFALAFVRARSFCAVPVIVAEGSGFRPAVARSKLLSVGYVGELAGIWFAVRGTMVVLLVPLLAVPWFLSDITGTQRVAAIGLLGGAFLLVACVAEIVESATAVTAYVDRRCRREAIDVVIPVPT